jgi:Type II secretion system protein C
MSLRYTVICALLMAAVFLLGYGNYRVWFSPWAVPPKIGQVKKGEIRPELPNPAGTAKEAQLLEGFSVIAEKNVFNPDRKEFSTAAAAAMSKPISRPQVTLQGVVLAEGYQSASIVNPGRPLHKGERETKSVRIGDMVGEYKLSKILPDRILLEAGEDSFEVLLYDPRSPKKRVEVKTATRPAAITSSVAAPPGPGVPPLVVAPAPTPAQLPQPPRPAVPAPVPRAPGQAQGGGYQPVPSPIPPAASSPATPDPGLWRGRRPNPAGGPG